jgi:PKD repeat protein
LAGCSRAFTANEKATLPPSTCRLFLKPLEERVLLAASIDAFVVPSVAEQGQAVAMSAQASSTISGASLTYTWNFGDNTSQSGVDLTDVTHTYNVPSPSGTPYNVTLTVTDGDQPATASAPLTIDEPTYQYTTPGDYTVALQVTDSNGMTSLSTLDVSVNAVPPTVNAGNNLTVTAGQLVQFNGSASDPSQVADPLTYAWDFNYDGTTFNPGSANSLTPYNVFTAPGTYTVALQATDSEGVSTLSTLTVTVNPSTSLVVNAGPDQAVNEGDTAAFSASYTDGSGTVNASTAQWDFNYDGTTFVPNANAGGTLTPTFQYTAPGTYGSRQ